LVRPLLDIDKAALERYAQEQGLEWIADPSNEERDFDRNFLRNAVLPTVQQRWPDAGARLSRSAALARDSAQLLADLADLDLAAPGMRASLTSGAAQLRVPALLEMSTSRARNLLRRALERCGLPAAPAKKLDSIIFDLLPAKGDAKPCVEWAGVSVRRYREWVYIATEKAQADFTVELLTPTHAVQLGPGFGSLQLVKDTAIGIRPAVAEAGLTLRVRHGGEEIKSLGQSHTRKLKKLLQEAAVLPWLRDRLPLLYAGDELVAVADLWLAAAFADDPGYRVDWQGKPALVQQTD
jgi:tRNA(Ile)-lysidine synthase